MAKGLICSIEGCFNPVREKSWCCSHFNRWERHKSPTAGRIDQGSAQIFFSEVVLRFKGEDCLIWPFGKDTAGYGRIWNGKLKRAENTSRMVCQEIYGPPPKGFYAAHSCGNGHEGCVNPKHLRWATPSENVNDTKIHRELGLGRFKRSA